MHEQQRVGVAYLQAATQLLNLIRAAHPTAGLLEAADLQWWWRTPRSTDRMAQLFWFDELGRPAAAVIATDWSGRIALDPIVLPGSAPAWVAQVIERGLAHAIDCGIGPVEVVVDRADPVMPGLLAARGFALDEHARLAVVGAWMDADARPTVHALPAGYRLRSRVETGPRPHHLVARSGPEVEMRLRQTSLYRPDLDLVILDGDGHATAYGLFWFDPQTATGLVEPMRTEQGHQRRGLARHLLGAGIERLARAGAARVKVCFAPDNPAAKALYLGAGFVPVNTSVVFSR